MTRVATMISAWWMAPVPLARVAVFRVAIYLFLIVDALWIANDVIQHGHVPELYQPTVLARVIQLPPLGVAGAWALLIVLIASSLLAATGRWPRAAGWTTAAAFWMWMLNSQGFSYVSHDHMALMIAVLVLPTVRAAGFDDQRTSQAAGWALRCVQVAVVLTYFGSVFSKWVRSGTLWNWANSAVFTWAIMRRGSDLIRWTLEYPLLLRVSQWGLLAIELLSPVVLFLRGRWLHLAIGVFLAFHTATFLALGIHFLPTVICWLAFLPLERLPQAILARRRSRPAPLPHTP